MSESITSIKLFSIDSVQFLEFRPLKHVVWYKRPHYAETAAVRERLINSFFFSKTFQMFTKKSL